MKQELTKLYEGIIGLAKVTAGKECNYRDYMESELTHRLR